MLRWDPLSQAACGPPGWWWASSKAPLDAGAGVIGGLDLKLIDSSATNAGAERRESDRSSDLFDLQLLMKILANVFEHFIKLGSVYPFRLKIYAYILNKLLKV